MGAEDDDLALGDVVDILDEDDAAALEPVHHVAVVHDLMEDMDGLARQEVEDLVHDIDRHADAGAEAPRVGQDDPHGAS
ncbi:MAG: hypothetical protein DHS20C14_02170 [Phycisphaeraceae bacterium]|nr:MAG: hypothetical protein DHS20C14_02170 [Phycisphaeraceae bacterium]